MKDDDIGWVSDVHGREEICIQGSGREAFGTPKSRCQDNIKMELKEIGWKRESGFT
jgi:hypothetical protein